MLSKYYLDLILYKTLIDLKTEAAKTYIGVLWWILDPIIFMAIFYLVFGVLLQRGTEHFAQFLLIGLVTWRWFQSTIIHGSTSIQQGRGLMRQVYMPKVILPLTIILTDLFKFTLVLLLLLSFLWFSGFTPTLAYLALPLVLALELALITGFTLLLAALVPFLPDLKFVVEHVLHVLFFLSGIFYNVEMIPEAYRSYLFLNPMAVLIDTYRGILMHDQWPATERLLWIALLALAVNALAWRVLRRCDRLYPKLLVG